MEAKSQWCPWTDNMQLSVMKEYHYIWASMKAMQHTSLLPDSAYNGSRLQVYNAMLLYKPRSKCIHQIRLCTIPVFWTSNYF